jgi:hypothetical protein
MAPPIAIRSLASAFDAWLGGMTAERGRGGVVERHGRVRISATTATSTADTSAGMSEAHLTVVVESDGVRAR